MDYGRLGKSELGNSTRSEPDSEVPTCKNPSPKSRKLKLLFIFSATFLVASAVSVAVLFGIRARGSGGANPSGLKPTLAISRTCSKTLYPDLCVDSLLQFPGAAAAGERDLVHISVNMTLQRVGKALYDTSVFSNLDMDPQLRSAYDDCLELLDESYDQLSRSLVNVAVGLSVSSDVMTWLSAALTNQDTCTEGLGDASGGNCVKTQMEEKLKDLSELVSNCLAIYSSSTGGSDFSGIPIQNRRRLLQIGDVDSGSGENPNRFPKWMSRKDRLLADTPASQIQADIVVAKDGSGTYTTIKEAIKKAPEKSNRRIIIHVKAGKYEEDILKVGRKKTNLMFIGDGKGKTVITGKKSVADKLTTFHTASFAAQGAGFIARDMTFENYAGPAKHQAVALRVGADHAVIYRCSIIGYQDTLYVHSNRQFYRDCDIYGTVDFIFGNAAVVLQNCNIYARKPMDNQKNTITAQNRKDPNQVTGISIHACKILATPELEASKGSFSTYLGRPWKMYSRVVYLMSFMGDHIHPQGWLEWNGEFALDTLYYGEYMNSGPGAAVGQRVKWPGYHVIKSTEEASKFTVSKFIYGSSWLPSTGVAYLAGLSV